MQYNYEKLEQFQDFETRINALALHQDKFSDSSEIKKFIVHRITSRDTIESIAKLYSLSVEDITNINKLEYPYIKDGSENIHVKKHGDRLLIPIAINSNINFADIEDVDIFLEGFEVAEDGELGWDDNQKDLLLQSGKDHAGNVLLDFFRTKQGELAYDLKYGNPIKLTGSPVRKEDLMVEQETCRAALEYEEIVSRAVAVYFKVIEGDKYLYYEIYPIGYAEIEADKIKLES